MLTIITAFMVSSNMDLYPLLSYSIRPIIVWFEILTFGPKFWTCDQDSDHDLDQYLGIVITIVDTCVTILVLPRSRYTKVYRSNKKYREMT